MRAQLAPRAAVRKSSISASTARHRVTGHSGTGTIYTLGPPRTSTPRRGWSWCRGQGRASAPGWALRRAASEGASQGAMPAPAQACSCSCPWLLEQDPAARGCLGWGGGGRPGTRAFSNATCSRESLHPWQRGSRQAGSPDAFPCRHESARPPWPLSCSPSPQPFPSCCCISPAVAEAAAPSSKPKAKRQCCSPPSFCAKAAAAPPAGLVCPREQ